MGLIDKVLSDVIENAFNNISNKLSEKESVQDMHRYQRRKDYDESIDGEWTSRIIEDEKQYVVPQFNNEEWVQWRKRSVHLLWTDQIGLGKDIPNKDTVRKMLIWCSDSAADLLYSDSYILWKMDQFVDKLNRDSGKYYIDERLCNYLSNEDNFMNFFDNIKLEIVRKAEEEQIEVDKYEPSDEIVDKYIDLKSDFDKLYYNIGGEN